MSPTLPPRQTAAPWRRCGERVQRKLASRGLAGVVWPRERPRGEDVQAWTWVQIFEGGRPHRRPSGDCSSCLEAMRTLDAILAELGVELQGEATPELANELEAFVTSSSGLGLEGLSSPPLRSAPGGATLAGASRMLCAPPPPVVHESDDRREREALRATELEGGVSFDDALILALGEHESIVLATVSDHGDYWYVPLEGIGAGAYFIDKRSGRLRHAWSGIRSEIRHWAYAQGLLEERFGLRVLRVHDLHRATTVLRRAGFRALRSAIHELLAQTPVELPVDFDWSAISELFHDSETTPSFDYDVITRACPP